MLPLLLLLLRHMLPQWVLCNPVPVPPSPLQAERGCCAPAAQRFAAAYWTTSRGRSTCASWRGAWPPRKPTCSWSWAAGWRRRVGRGALRSGAAAQRLLTSSAGIVGTAGSTAPALLSGCVLAAAVDDSIRTLPGCAPWLRRRWSATGSGSWKARSRRLPASPPAPARWVGSLLPAAWLVCHLGSVWGCPAPNSYG